MKKLLLLTMASILFGESNLMNGLERASDRHKREACQKAKALARENYKIQDINVGCNCEKNDAREWMCFVRFTYIKSKQN